MHLRDRIRIFANDISRDFIGIKQLTQKINYECAVISFGIESKQHLLQARR